jgi:Fic family protein
MALMHYQFEAIHPFSDGNGRTGRILNVLYLIQQNLLTEPILYLSSYLIRHKNEYYSRLRNVTEKGEWVEWILYILNGITEIANSTRFRSEQIKAAMDETLATFKEKLPPRIASKALVETLFYYPYCKQKFLVENLKITRQTASVYLN